MPHGDSDEISEDITYDSPIKNEPESRKTLERGGLMQKHYKSVENNKD
jgi:hypothetical protein